MRLSHLFMRLGVFAGAAVACTLAARATVAVVEDVSVMAVQEAVVDADLPWAAVMGDGLQIVIEGQAPTEAARFRAMSAAGSAVDAARVIDNMSVADSGAIAAPDFAVEILRGDTGVSIIGLIPASTDQEALDARIAAIADGAPVTDLLEAADYPTPATWPAAMDYALNALDQLPRAKISVSADRVTVSAIADSTAQKSQMEAALARNAPQGLRRIVNITAPRPVISPFTTRFVLQDGAAGFDACAVDTPDTQARIIAAATAAGFDGDATCVEALGVPSRNWGEAVALGIGAVADIGGGTVTLANTDVTFVGLESTDQATFDRVAGVLENALPDEFALTVELPRAPDATTAGPPTFTASLSEDGAVQLGGRLSDDLATMTVENFAAAKFGAADVTLGTRLSADLPQDWSVRVLAGLEALAQLSDGRVVVTPDQVTVTGRTGSKTAASTVTSLLLDKLGQTAEADLDIVYVEELDPVAGLPTPQECIASVTTVTEAQKILFDPGSATVSSGSQPILDEIADLLERCPDIPMRIAGYTDSQGGEEMNQSLSQSRAEAVLDALRIRRVPIASFEAIGYGEADPIADNGTEEGREANRRIAFSLVSDTAEEAADADADADAEEVDSAETDATDTETDATE
ncbi:OmpA-OmpF porin, OOP family [Loktanella fryxellensis]|uniref:OmpA-OmpF porin, OOP family n=1 Tax=Loktanella fryxellensis TaxID=245187 RepID=A0A1H8AF17_9RHOB|nr:OmpA family protein [Loktanella fryxellensis]SEM69076.1 OmpA-OmpF porin, OOP family [Loktanella fryxellensis]